MTEIEICNLALSNIRARSINSLDEASLAAQQCKLKYPIMRDYLLKQESWGFATVIKPLALKSGASVFNWVYAYQYPSDAIVIDRVILDLELYTQGSTGLAPRARLYPEMYIPDIEQQVPYKVFNIAGERVVAANDENLRAEYRSSLTDPSLFPIDFAIALSHLLASELAIPLAGGDAGRAMRSDELNLYSNFIANAVADERNQGYSEMPESEFITARR